MMRPGIDYNPPSHLLDDERYHAPFDDNVVYNASTASHGFMPKLSGTSTQTLTGDGLWTDIIYYESVGVTWKRFTNATSTDIILWATSSTNYNATAVATTFFYPVIEIVIPPWIQQSTINLKLVVAACSSDTDYGANINSGFYLFSGRGKMTAGLELGDSTLYTRIPGMLQYFAVDSGTSGATTHSTELSIVGGETFTVYALSTCANQIMLNSVQILGKTYEPVMPSESTFGNIMLTTNQGTGP